MINIKNKKLVFPIASIIIIIFHVGFKAKAENVSLPLKIGDVDQNLGKVINIEKITLKQQLKQLTTEEKQQIFPGKWNLSVTYNENDVIILINGFSIYRDDNTVYERYEMRLFNNQSNEILTIITVEGESSWWVNNNIMTEKITNFKIINVKSYIPNVTSNEIKASIQQELEQEIGKPVDSEIISISKESIVLKELETGKIFTLIREE